MQRLSREQREEQNSQTAGLSRRKILFAILAIILVYAGVDLFWSFNRDLRQCRSGDLSRFTGFNFGARKTARRGDGDS